MVTLPRWVSFVVVVLLLLAAARPAAAQVEDHAHLFSARAVTRANTDIKRLQRRTRRGILVATFPAIPAALAPDYKPQQKVQFFRKWARQLGREHALHGTVVLLCMKPGRVQVVASGKLGRTLLRQPKRHRIAEHLAHFLQHKQYDGALAYAVATVGAAYGAGNAAQGGHNAAAAHHLGWLSYLCCCGVPLVLLFGAFMLFLRRQRAGMQGMQGMQGMPGQGPPMGPGGGVGPYAGPGMGGGGYGVGGGSSFGTGLLGGALGGLLGGWLFDRTRGAGEAAPMQPPAAPEAGAALPDASASTGPDLSQPPDWSGGSGDQGGGADFNSGDAGASTDVADSGDSGGDGGADFGGGDDGGGADSGGGDDGGGADF